MAYAYPTASACDESWALASSYSAPAADACDEDWSIPIDGGSTPPVTARVASRFSAMSGSLARVSARCSAPASSPPLIAALLALPAELLAGGAAVAARLALPAELLIAGGAAAVSALLALPAELLAGGAAVAARLALPAELLIAGGVAVVAGRLALPAATTATLSARLVATAAATSPVASRVVCSAAYTTPAASRLSAPAAALAFNVVAARLNAPSSAPDAAISLLTGPNYLLHQGRSLAIGEDTDISADEGSPHWIATIDLMLEPDYAAVQLGDLLTLVFWGQPIALMCDGRRFSRGETGAPRFTLSAISPAAALGAPWAVKRDLGSAGLARATASAVLGQSVTWEIPDWLLPDTAAALRSTPLDLARQIAAAVAGVIESQTDGTLRARRLYPVSPPDYAAAVPVATLTDRDLLSHSDSADSADLENRFIITSGDPAATSAQIQIEQERDPADPHAYTVRAYPWPWRPVDLAHTGNSTTNIGARTEVLTDHAELLEVQAGAASLGYPLASRIAARYQHVSLGRVDIVGRELTTAIADYSLLAIEYRARAWEWRVTNATTETIQFLAIE